VVVKTWVVQAEVGDRSVEEASEGELNFLNT
jgi:hypothetical protein